MYVDALYKFASAKALSSWACKGKCTKEYKLEKTGPGLVMAHFMLDLLVKKEHMQFFKSK